MDQQNTAGPELYPAEAPERRRGAQPGNNNARRKAKAEAQSLKVPKVTNLLNLPDSSEKPKRKRGAPKGNTNAKAEKKLAAAMAETPIQFSDEAPPKKKMGRPRTRPERDPGPFRVGRPPAIELNDDTLRRISLLAKVRSTKAEAAAHFDVDPVTFDSFLTRHKKASDTWTKGECQFNTSLRSKMVELANAGNVTMTIWLSKQFLGMKDRHEHSGDPDAPMRHDVRMMPVERFEAIARQVANEV